MEYRVLVQTSYKYYKLAPSKNGSGFFVVRRVSS